MLKEKEVIENRYEVTKLLNSIDLYEVTDLRMRTEWVMKEIFMEEYCANNTILQKDPEKLIGELEQMKKINHRFFPKVMEIIRKEKYIYVIMEKVSGTVAQEINKKKCGTREVVNWAIQLCDGLQYMEQSEISQRIIYWKYGMGDLLIEGGSIRVQNFEIKELEAEVKQENIENIGSFIVHMLDGQLKFSGRLKKIVGGCRKTDSVYDDYKELSEELERYLLERAKGKRLKKRGTILAAVLLLILVVGSAGINGIKIFSQKKTEKEEERSGPVPTKTAEITQKTKNTPTPASATKKPTISPIVTTAPKETESAEKKTAVTAEPRKIVRTNAPVITAAPDRQPKKRRVVTTARPKPKVTKKPDSVDIELEDNDMDIIVE